jgi:hypothetical protein
MPIRSATQPRQVILSREVVHKALSAASHGNAQ